MHEQYCYVRVELCGHTCHKKWSLSQQMRGQAVLSPLAERRWRRRKAPLLALVSLAESPACVHIMRVFAFVFGIRTCMCTCACVHVVYVYTHTHTYVHCTLLAMAENLNTCIVSLYTEALLDTLTIMATLPLRAPWPLPTR